jgi:hypothetical protein
MLWSPVVHRSSGKPKYDQWKVLRQVQEDVESKTGTKIELVINEKYQKALKKLRAFASKESKELKSPIMRFLQIEEKAKKLNRPA